MTDKLETIGFSMSDTIGMYTRCDFNSNKKEFIGNITICYPDASIKQIKQMLRSMLANIELFEKVNKL